MKKLLKNPWFWFIFVMVGLSIARFIQVAMVLKKEAEAAGNKNGVKIPKLAKTFFTLPIMFKPTVDAPVTTETVQNDSDDDADDDSVAVNTLRTPKFMGIYNSN